MKHTILKNNSRDQIKGGERMKKVLVISMVMVFAVAMMASAGANNWVAYVEGLQTSGTLAQSGCTIGQWSGASDQLTDTSAGSLAALFVLDEPTTDPGSGFPASPVLVSSQSSYVDIRSTTLNQTWTMAVSNPGAGSTTTFKILFDNVANNDVVGDWAMDASYALPTNLKFTVSGMGISDTFSASSLGTAAANRTKVYTATGLTGNITITASPDVVTPEPGSMLALGSGLVGLVGFTIRRRK